MKKIVFIIPAYNEERNVTELHSQISENISELSMYKFTFLFIENGSTDNTYAELLDLVKFDKNVKILKLSRNFKMDGAIAAGINTFDGDAAIIMTANLQDDPKVIIKFIRKWEEGYEHVYGVVKSRPGKSKIRQFNSKLFYKLANKFSDSLIPENVSDFRLVDKKVLDAVKSLNEVNRFYRGFFSWVGFKSIGVEFNRQKRFSGTSHAKTLPVLSFAIRGILAFSVKPLRLSIFFTLLTSMVSFSVLLFQIYNWISNGVPFDGFGTLVGLLLLFFSLIFLTLSILSEYLGLIYEETKKRPHFIISEKINF
jgi:glycosyltransferase involved in cell wall biosynthesis